MQALATPECAPEYQGLVRTVRVFPDPVLKKMCDEVNDMSGRVIVIIDDLLQTMLSLPRCVGLAAPQIGELVRVVVVDVSRHPKSPPKNHGLLCMINPVITQSLGSRVSREGCVSVPDLTGNVGRSEQVAVRYFDRDGVERTIEANGFEAIAIQHELDHLDGMLFLDRVTANGLFKRKRSD